MEDGRAVATAAAPTGHRQTVALAACLANRVIIDEALRTTRDAARARRLASTAAHQRVALRACDADVRHADAAERTGRHCARRISGASSGWSSSRWCGRDRKSVV